jgi:hypothetical protein
MSICVHQQQLENEKKIFPICVPSSLDYRCEPWVLGIILYSRVLKTFYKGCRHGSVIEGLLGICKAWFDPQHHKQRNKIVYI